MENNVVFSIADETKVKDIVLLCNEVFEESTIYEEALKSFLEHKNDNNQIYVIGELDGKVIAHARIVIIPTMFEDMGTYAILNHVCVKPEYRKHHIATHMLKYVENICKERGCKDMKLWSKNFREAAHACYKRYGFKSIEAAFFEKEV